MGLQTKIILEPEETSASFDCNREPTQLYFSDSTPENRSAAPERPNHVGKPGELHSHEPSLMARYSSEAGRTAREDDSDGGLVDGELHCTCTGHAVGTALTRAASR